MVSFINNISELQKHQQLSKHGSNAFANFRSISSGLFHTRAIRARRTMRGANNWRRSAGEYWLKLSGSKKKKKGNRGEKEKRRSTMCIVLGEMRRREWFLERSTRVESLADAVFYYSCLSEY